MAGQGGRDDMPIFDYDIMFCIGVCCVCGGSKERNIYPLSTSFIFFHPCMILKGISRVTIKMFVDPMAVEVKYELKHISRITGTSS